MGVPRGTRGDSRADLGVPVVSVGGVALEDVSLGDVRGIRAFVCGEGGCVWPGRS